MLSSQVESGPLLAIDSGSSLLSVAIGGPEGVMATVEAPFSRSSATVMGLLDGCLDAAGIGVAELTGVVVLAGPGSFTGLRVGMSIGLGLRQSLGIAAGALPTFLAMAGRVPDPDRPAMLLIRALRDEWYAQRPDDSAEPPDTPARLRSDELLAIADCQMIGFDLEPLAERSPPTSTTTWHSPGRLAEAALLLAEGADWSPEALTTPRYLAPPPIRHPNR